MRTAALVSVFLVSVLTAACSVGLGTAKDRENQEEKGRKEKTEALWAVLDFEPKDKNLSRAEVDSFSERLRSELSRYVKVMPRAEMLEKLGDSTLVRSESSRSLESILDIGDLLVADVVVKGGVFKNGSECGFMMRAIDINLGAVTGKMVETRIGEFAELVPEMSKLMALRLVKPDTSSSSKSRKKLEELRRR